MLYITLNFPLRFKVKAYNLLNKKDDIEVRIICFKHMIMKHYNNKTIIGTTHFIKIIKLIIHKYFDK